MLTRFGGFGQVLKHFVPRLKRHGIEQSIIDRIMVDNPAMVFLASS